MCLAGCSSLPGPFGTWVTTDITLLRSGPATRMTATAVSNTVNQAATAPSTAEMASVLTQIPRTAGNWQPLVLVGESYIDLQCSNYLEAVRLLYRQKQEGDTSLTSLQSATVGIMGLAEAAQKAIGIVGISFGLAQSLFDTHLSSYLYRLPPSSVSSIVESQRQILRAVETGQVPASACANLNNEAAALRRLQEYITYCTSVVIEDNVSKVLNTSTAGASGTKITSTTTPAVVPIGSQFATSSNTRATLQS